MAAPRARIVLTLVFVLVALGAALGCNTPLSGCWDPSPDCKRLGGHWDEGCRNCIGARVSESTPVGESRGTFDAAPSAPSLGPLCDEVDAGHVPFDAGDETTDDVCGEASCVPITVRGIGSHFTGLGCTGIESYYTPYNDCDGIRRSWDGQGLAGTIIRTETNRSFMTDDGTCIDYWPSGNTLRGFVRIYR